MDKPTVLVIDDNPSMLRTLRHILSPLYDVKVAKGGEAGIKAARKSSVDLILLDLIMPEISGFDVMEQLKKDDALKNIPVIFITGSDSPEDEKKALDDGALNYILKPFSEDAVRRMVGKYLNS